MHSQQSAKFQDYSRTYFDPHKTLTAAKRDELIMAYTPLIKYIAARLVVRLPPQVSLDDLTSCGVIGLIDAINKFDLSKNVQFKTYAEFRIKGAMLDELRALDWVPRSIRKKITGLENIYIKLEKKLGRSASDEETAAALQISIDEYYQLLDETKTVSFINMELIQQKTSDIPAGINFIDTFIDNDADPYAALNISQLRKLTAKAISELPNKEKLTVALYYYEELTMKEIGQILGYTESRISQMHSKAMLRLRAKLKKT